MDNSNLLIVCRSCGRKVLMHNMRPDGTGENMICIDCSKRTAPTKLMTLKEAAAEAEKPRKPAPTEKMIKYICPGCKYKFSKKASQPVHKCPYCGKTNIILDNDLGAENLLKSSLDKRFEHW